MLVQIINRPFILFEHESHLSLPLSLPLFHHSAFFERRVFIPNTIDKKIVVFCSIFFSFHFLIVFILNAICHLSFDFTFVSLFFYFSIWMEKIHHHSSSACLKCVTFTHIHRQFNSMAIWNYRLTLCFRCTLSLSHWHRLWIVFDRSIWKKLKDDLCVYCFFPSSHLHHLILQFMCDFCFIVR